MLFKNKNKIRNFKKLFFKIPFKKVDLKIRNFKNKNPIGFCPCLMVETLDPQIWLGIAVLPRLATALAVARQGPHALRPGNVNREMVENL